MISKDEINEILSKYNLQELRIATICSHSALQIFHGAKQEGFRTLGICMEESRLVYDAFPLARPDEYLMVRSYKEVRDPKFQEALREKNAIIVPHGSFVEYVGSEEIERGFYVPMFGNRKVLEWERDRNKQKLWLQKAGLRIPREYEEPSKIDGRVIVKFPGARGGKGYFTANSEKSFYEKLEDRVRRGLIKREDCLRAVIQEFIAGVRYYPHFFYSIFGDLGFKVAEGRIELLSMDKRIETIDEVYRGLPGLDEDFLDYTVSGNQPVIVRESLLTDVIKAGVNVVKASMELMPPGIIGPFCIETIYNPKRGFIAFEISARIVAGTNLYPQGSPYTCYLFNEFMSTGRRISREIKIGVKRKELEKVVY